MPASITTTTNQVDWPLNQPLDRERLFAALGLRAVDEHGQDITDRVAINDRQLDLATAGSYPLYLTAVTPVGQQLSQQVTIRVGMSRHEGTSPTQLPVQKKRHHWALITLGTLLALVVILFGIHAVNANRAAQNAQSAQTSSQISSLQHQTGDLRDQLDQLKAAQRQYQQDHDQAALNQKLDQLQSDNQQLRNKLGSQEQDDLNNLNNAINQVKNHPSQGATIVNRLDGESNNLTAYLTQLRDNIQAWLNGQN